MFGRRESFRVLIRNQHTSLQEQIRNQHEEFLRVMEEREEESRQREERLDSLVEETREFNREILLRNEKVYTSVLARLEEMGKQLEEGRLQIRANTDAVLRLLDRFDEPGGAAA